MGYFLFYIFLNENFNYLKIYVLVFEVFELFFKYVVVDFCEWDVKFLEKNIFMFMISGDIWLILIVVFLRML